MFLASDIAGDSNIGMYGFATRSYAVLGVRQKNLKEFQNVLRVPVIIAPVFDTWLSGLFLAGNAHGIVVPAILEKECDVLKQRIEHVLMLESKCTALGNLMLANDHGVILSPLLRRSQPAIESFFGIPCAVGTIAGQNVIGSLGCTTNKGCITHPGIKPDEQRLIEKVLGVPVMTGTVNYGSMYPRMGLIANDYGVVSSDVTTGHEMGNVLEAFKLRSTDDEAA